MTFKELCLRRQACRNYTSQPVEREKLDYILECARLAPSAVNKQPWKVYLLESDDSKAKACAFYNREWVKSAPMFLLCCIKHDEEWVRKDGKQHGVVDVSILAEHICIAAAEMGLDTCWVCNFDVDMATSSLRLPSGEEPVVLIPIGYSIEDVRPKERKELSTIVETI